MSPHVLEETWYMKILSHTIHTTTTTTTAVSITTIVTTMLFIEHGVNAIEISFQSPADWLN